MVQLTIIMPAYNEEARIGSTLEVYIEFFRARVLHGDIESFEVIAVLNACKDDTLGVVQKYQKQYKEIRYLNFKQGGKGFAIIEGFKHARGELVGFVDADMATPPEAFYDLVRKLGNHDGIIANRWSPQSLIKTQQPFSRVITSRVFNFLVRGILLMPYRDTQCGCKLFRKKAILVILPWLNITRWAFDIDLLYNLRNHGFSIIDCPTIWEDKKESHLQTLKVSFQMFSALVRLRLVHSPFSFVIRLYDVLPELVKVHHR